MEREYFKIIPSEIMGVPEKETLGPEVQIVVDQKSGTIVKIGDPRDVNEWIKGLESKKRLGETPSIRITDLKIEEGALCPGLVDTHTHPTSYSMLEATEPAFLSKIKDKKSLIEQLKRRHRAKEGIVLGIGWSTKEIPHLSREDLDKVSKDTPIIAMDTSFHGSVVNTKGLEIINKLSKAREKDIGRPLKGEKTERTGRITEEYSILAFEVAEAEHSVEKLAETRVEWIEEQLNRGITSIHDMVLFNPGELASMIKSAEIWGKRHPGVEFPITEFYIRPEVLTIIQTKSEKIGDLFEKFEALVKKNMVGLKIFKDGSIGSYTAELGETYLDKETKGIEVDTIETAKKAFKIAQEMGIKKIATHAIGDEAIRKAIEFAQRWLEADDNRRFRIEHFEIAGEPEIKKVAETGIWISSQPNFITDIYAFEKRLGKERASLICPHKSIVKADVSMMFGTDGMPQNILFALWCATHHPNEKERLTLEEAFIAAAAMAGEYEKNKRGRFIEGASADFMIIDPSLIDNILKKELSSEEIKAVLEPDGSMEDLCKNLDEGIKAVIKSGKIIKDLRERK